MNKKQNCIYVYIYIHIYIYIYIYTQVKAGHPDAVCGSHEKLGQCLLGDYNDTLRLRHHARRPLSWIHTAESACHGMHEEVASRKKDIHDKFMSRRWRPVAVCRCLRGPPPHLRLVPLTAWLILVTTGPVSPRPLLTLNHLTESFGTHGISKVLNAQYSLSFVMFRFVVIWECDVVFIFGHCFDKVNRLGTFETGSVLIGSRIAMPPGALQ